jgi:tetratricopeptide (TPR) repeat protein
MKLLKSDSFTQKNLKNIAREAVASHILKGTYIKLGDNYRVDVVLQDARTLNIIGAERADGVGDNAPLAMVDSLTKKLKPHFNLTKEQIADDLDAEIATVTSPNPRAIYFYTEALKALNSRNFNEAIESFENAIALDPDFAMAYRMLSGTYNRLALEVDSKDEYWEKFTENREKMVEAAKRRPPSERERLYIENSDLNRTYPEQLHSLYKLLEIYPDDEYGNGSLGAILAYHWNENDLAKKYLEPLIQNNTNNQLSYHWLSEIYRRQGLYGLL